MLDQQIKIKEQQRR